LAVGDFKIWLDDDSENCCGLVKHYSASHEGEDFVEGLFSRLWVLQEIILSDNLQFGQCDYTQSKQIKEFPPSSPFLVANRLSLQLRMLCSVWVGYGGKFRANHDNEVPATFIQAFF
jgi:hypothetical protein